jgi:hypothetical protein
VAAIFDAVQCYINNSGAFNKFTQKLKSILLKKINFDWITCNVHNNDLKNEILTSTIKLVIFKTLQDIQRKFDKKKWEKKYERRLNIFSDDHYEKCVNLQK